MLSKKTSIGGFGRYMPDTTDDVFAFPTGHFRDPGFYTSGPQQEILFWPDRPRSYACRQRDNSWTGVTFDYQTQDASGAWVDYLTLQLRSTLPGPLFQPKGPKADRLLLHFTGGSLPRVVTCLTTSTNWRPDDTVCGENEQAFLIETRDAGKFLLLSSAPVARVCATCQRHQEIIFAEDEPNVLIVPLLNAADADRAKEHLAVWLDLVARPPLEVSESFTEDRAGGRISVSQQFEGDNQPPLWSPLPYAASHLIAEPPADQPLVEYAGDAEPVTLLDTYIGPYTVTPGAANGYSIDTRWMAATVAPSRTVATSDELGPVPDELSYAGDWTWDPDSAMDRLLSFRSWGHMLQASPEVRRNELLSILQVPSAEEVRASLMTVTEPDLGITWAKDKALFHQKGKHISFDTDWYNGLFLSGLYRATQCGEPAIEDAARALSAELRPERAQLLAYYTVFQDWQISIGSMDTHFSMFNCDCSHNGLEGVLAEARLRDAEGDSVGASECRYIAAKAAMPLLSAISLPRWLEAREIPFVETPQPGSGWTCAEADDRRFGSLVVHLISGVLPVTPATRNPYQFAGHFPEYTSMIKQHGRVDQFAEIAGIWEKEFPARYQDWITHYIGEDWKERFTSAYDQEARIQAAVFYALAPEVCLRLWILGEDPASIEQRFQPAPINLGEQLLLRGHYQLHEPGY